MAIAFAVTGKFVVSAFAMLLLVFLTDFAKISLATDNVRPSKNPETWNIGGYIAVSVTLGVVMVAVRVREGDDVNLRKWPTNVEPLYGLLP